MSARIGHSGRGPSRCEGGRFRRPEAGTCPDTESLHFSSSSRVLYMLVCMAYAWRTQHSRPQRFELSRDAMMSWMWAILSRISSTVRGGPSMRPPTCTTAALKVQALPRWPRV